MEALTEPSDWKFQPLEELDQLLRCPICFDYYKTAMLSPQCSHNFCSLCIRRYLSSSKSKCPMMCAASIQEADLKNNRLLDQIVHQFNSSRKVLQDLVQRAAVAEVGKRNGLQRIVSQSHTPTLSSSHRTRLVAATVKDRAPGKKRLYSVPEAPELLDSEAFVGDIVLASEQRNDGLLSHNVEDVQAGEVEEEEEGGIGMAGEREQSSCSVSVAGCDREDPAAIRTPKAEGGSGLMPWLPEEDLAWEGRGKRPRLFGDLGESGSGESGRKKMKMEIGIQTHSESTPSRSSFHHRSASFSTSSPLPPPSPSLLSPRPSPHVSAQSQIHNASGSGSVSADTPSSSGEVECPVCGVLVQRRFINRHLDNLCLKSATAQSSTNTDPSQRKYSKLPRMVYTIMKDKQLKTKLKEYHLSTQGNRSVLIFRLKEFILRFNSQCDSLDPKSPREMAQELQREEQAQQSSRQPGTPVMNVKRDSTAEEVEREHTEYEQLHRDQFSKLVMQARERRKGGEREGDRAKARWTRDREEDTYESSNSDTDERSVLVPDSPDRDQTPELNINQQQSIPESPQPSGFQTRQLRSKRRHSSPSPPPSLPPSPVPPPVPGSREEGEVGEGSDPEFVPFPTYRTPSSSHKIASKRARRY